MYSLCLSLCFHLLLSFPLVLLDVLLSYFPGAVLVTGWSDQGTIQQKANKFFLKVGSCWIKSLAAWSLVLELGKGINAELRFLLTLAAWA